MRVATLLHQRIANSRALALVQACQRATALDARGNEIPGNEHDILTGSDPDGRAFLDGYDHTCNNWTSDAMTLPQANPNVPPDRARAMLGHMDRTGGQNVSWNAAHMSQGCSKQALINTGGATAADIEGLGEEVRRRVFAMSGISLDWEIKRIGIPGGTP